MALSEGDKAIIVALESLRDRVVMLPLAIAQNAAQAAAETARPQGANAPAERANLLSRGMSSAASSAATLALRFAAVLGPLAALATYLHAPTSGLNVFTGALRLLAAAVAPIVLPAMFLLATALAAASDVIFRELLPAMEGFFRFIIQSGIPAVIQFAETVGRATRALMWLADSQIGKIAVEAAGGGASGGFFGGLNRTLDRAGNVGTDRRGPDTGKSYAESIRDTASDLFKIVSPFSATGLDRMLGVEPNTQSANSGASQKSADAVERARRDTLQELILSMGPKASSSGLASVYSRAQMAAFQSPYERRMLELTTEIARSLSRAESPLPPGTGTGTSPATTSSGGTGSLLGDVLISPLYAALVRARR